MGRLLRWRLLSSGFVRYPYPLVIPSKLDELSKSSSAPRACRERPSVAKEVKWGARRRAPEAEHYIFIFFFIAFFIGAFILFFKASSGEISLPSLST